MEEEVRWVSPKGGYKGDREHLETRTVTGVGLGWVIYLFWGRGMDASSCR